VEWVRPTSKTWFWTLCVNVVILHLLLPLQTLPHFCFQEGERPICSWRSRSCSIVHPSIVSISKMI
jgi:hypothetical protein